MHESGNVNLHRASCRRTFGPTARFVRLTCIQVTSSLERKKIAYSLEGLICAIESYTNLLWTPKHARTKFNVLSLTAMEPFGAGGLPLASVRCVRLHAGLLMETSVENREIHAGERSAVTYVESNDLHYGREDVLHRYICTL